MILAGGRSQRFGSDKALATWMDRTFLEAVHDALDPHVDTVHVLARPDHADRYRELVPEARVRSDREAFQGPTEALREHLPEAPQIVVASVDAPGLRRSSVRHLLAAGWDQVAVARTDEGLLPTLMAGPYKALRGRLEDADRLLEVARGALEVEVLGRALNVNRPQEGPSRAR